MRRISFWIVTGLTGAFLLVALLPTYPLLFTNWLPADAWLAVRPDRAAGDQIHRLHSLALALISWGMLSGIALQLHRPRRKLGALLMALATVLAVACGLALAGTFTVAGMAPFVLLPLATCALHPSARSILRPPRLDPRMLALAACAAVPWLGYATGMAEVVRAVGPNSDIEHLTFMIIVALAIVLWALLGATDESGWAFPAGAAIVASACIGLQSLIFQDALSGLEWSWASAALLWCAAYATAARFRSSRTRQLSAAD